jgi:hypothetical protein
MKTKTFATLAFAAALAALAAMPAGALPVYVKIAPPAPIVETRVVAPGPGYVWVGGYHRWDGAAYVWVPGRWAQPPRPHAVWVGGRWVHHGHHGWYWKEGHWK